MSEVFEQNQECLFCGKLKTWESVLIGMGRTRMPLFIVTVCPDCRGKHTIKEIYDKALERIKENMEKTLKGEI